ncbi:MULTISPECIES: DUF2218 domain-containing protein [unclassified Actinomyces]|uniref:DUF2218 domain-containing protein n=1 Tax=unclassified Actinomyces TaxID=2609248 RepID=UPI002017BD5D|nr:MULTISPECIES: DUF2218 domain-containing protein [unclassified Actinomyces]MCL3777396.1 DUF2218 domain-containing protein [Actinomyces sp. AC-20-1]MCL3789082.1 DUF2218 domain-containing protein [Actinomyces sp. 187325]MCL3791655.1 DUF2218 domain-containing protein [Actinomyces sp. 186855]MCL3793883.1 DUF2218 domain-containing protein [Actinomyces sp. 217892]
MSAAPVTGTFDRTSVARVATDRPARYGHQLVSHMGRKIEGAWDRESSTGWMSFTREGPSTGLVALSCDEGVLELRLSTTEENLERLEQVTGIHLARFGQRDGLAVSWTREGGTAGTTQGPLTTEDMERMRREREARQRGDRD